MVPTRHEDSTMSATQEVSEAVRAFAEHEHQDLARGIDLVHDAACAVGDVPSVATELAMRDIIAWFDFQVRPHLAWEERWLYPRIEGITGTPWSTRASRFDHGQLMAAIESIQREEFEALHGMSKDLQRAIRCSLFSLEALIRAHVELEQGLLLPVLSEAGEEPDRPVRGRPLPD
jgi:hemerythrin-like domain-containing protein